MLRTPYNIVIAIIMCVLLSACVQTGRYTMKNDKAPLRKPTTLEMQSPTPKYEPIYPWSIKPYTVRNKRYVPLKTAKGYQAQGMASWYGRKFHGHTTANGEIYDMFAMTAAHRTLPIPSYVSVTNTSNNKSIIVRVNDRGPFHPKRVIDLSYSAAYALDILTHGVAEVKLQAIVIDKHQIPLRMNNSSQIDTATPIQSKPQQKNQQKQTNRQQINAHKVELKPVPLVKSTGRSDMNDKKPKQRFVQVLASSDAQKIRLLGKQLSDKYKQQHMIVVDKGIYKLRLGPLQSNPQAQSLIDALQNNGYHGAYMLYTKASLAHN